jgi:hypothetical protein
MSINEIGGISHPMESSKGKKAREVRETAPPQKDSVRVSDEARSLFEAEQSKRYNSIQERIQSGFYFQREVTEKIVEALMKDIGIQ